MLIKIGNFEFTEVWDGVLYKKLSNYPQITDWEIRTILEFIEYETQHGRECSIECPEENVRKAIREAIARKERYLSTPPPEAADGMHRLPSQKRMRDGVCVSYDVCRECRKNL